MSIEDIINQACDDLVIRGRWQHTHTTTLCLQPLSTIHNTPTPTHKAHLALCSTLDALEAGSLLKESA